MVPAKPIFRVFLTGAAGFAAKSSKMTVFQYQISRCPRPVLQDPGNRNFYVLLCMFNGFAFARPFCQAIKVSLTG